MSEILLRVTTRNASSGVASLRYKAWYMAIITPSRHMETLMLAIVKNVRRRLRQQFFRTRGRNRNMRVLLVYEFPRRRDLAFSTHGIFHAPAAATPGIAPAGGAADRSRFRRHVAARGLRATIEQAHDFRP